MSKKERLVAAIENGTVIDHIPSVKNLSLTFMIPFVPTIFDEKL